MDYKQAFFTLVGIVLERAGKAESADECRFDGIAKEVFGILDKLDDKTTAIEFAVTMGTPTNLGDIDEPLPLAQRFIGEKLLKLAGSSKTLEELQKEAALEEEKEKTQEAAPTP